MRRQVPTLNQGFTLLEMLVSLALVAVLLGAVAGVAVRVTENLTRSREHRRQAQNIHASFHLMERDLSTFHHGFEGSPALVKFTALRDSPFPEEPRSGQIHVTYRLVRGEETDILYRAEADPLLTVPSLEAPLLEGRDITFLFLNEHGNEEGVWFETNRKAPMLVRVTLEDTRGHSWQRDIPLMVTSNER